MRPAALFCILSMIPFSALSQTACKSFNDYVDSAIVNIAVTIVREVSDSTVQQRTARYLSIGNYLQLLSINLNLYAQNKCPPRTAPIDPFQYHQAAASCRAAQNASEDVAQKCAFKNWKADLEK